MLEIIPVSTMLFALIVGGGYAAVRGGPPERWGAALLFVSVVLSNVVAFASQRHFVTPDMGLMAVDLIFLVGAVVIALRAQRYWPMWVAALQLDTMLTHLLKFSSFAPPFSYAFALWLWGLPVPLLLAAGAWRHRQRIKQWGSDPAWS